MTSVSANHLFGQWLSSPPSGEEVVISGMSGYLPESRNIQEFHDHLLNKEEMVSGDGRRWEVDHREIPQRTAKIHDIDKYDAGYFGVHSRQADNMDPMMRMMLETAIGAIMDAGVNPEELEGSSTGVFISTSWSDMEVNTCFHVKEEQMFPLTGYLRSLISHRISYFLKLKGPAYNVDTACSSSMNSLDNAFKAIRSGRCENAIVGGTNLLLHPGISLQFFRLGVLSPEGICKVFDQDASGYVRGETIACVFLQKAKNSRRIYARVINTHVGGDGFKEQGITFPSPIAQELLMNEIYKDSGIAPSRLSFMEAHGTGTQVGDPQEVEAIDRALAQKRDQELLVGSVKSSIGHTEPASGVCSIIKVLLAMESGLITPNINLKKIKEGMKGFGEKRMKVVTELTPLKEDDAIVGINNFGFGGNNAHAILKRHNKVRVNRQPEDDLPRLVCVSGRSEEGVLKMLEEVGRNGLDEDQVALFHQLFKKNFQQNFFRGYTIVAKSGTLKMSSKWVRHQPGLYVFFGQFTNNFKLLGSYLMKFEMFKESVMRINKILIQKHSKPLSEILGNHVEQYQNILGSICVQIALVDIFRALQIHPTAIYSDSYAKLVSAYHHQVITLEETVSAALKISQLDFDTDVHFKSEIKKFAEDKLKGDSLSNESWDKLSRRGTVLNLSDSRLNDQDVLLVEQQEVRFLETLGRLFEEGHNPQIQKLYPQVNFPVSRGTPMISPIMNWDHRKSWYTFKFSEFTSSDAEQQEYSITYLYEEYKFITGHVIDERNLFPATEYLFLVWQTFAQSRRLLVDDLPVIFTDCRFIRAVAMPKTGFLALLVTVQRGTGHFEIMEKNVVVVSGKIQICTDSDREFTNFKPVELEEDPNKLLQKDEIYRELYLRGYNYSGLFKGIEKCNVDASSGLITWENNWCTFMDKMLQMQILRIDTRLLFVPVGIRKLVVDPRRHLEMVHKLGDEDVQFPVYTHPGCNIIQSGGIEIHGLNAKSISKRKPRLLPVLEKHVFVPNCSPMNLEEAVRVNTQIILENSLEINFNAVELVDDNTKPEEFQSLLSLISQALDDVPLVTPKLTISTRSPIEETPGVKVEVVTLTPESKLLLVVGSNLLKMLNSHTQFLTALKQNGFVLTREDVHFQVEDNPDIEIITEYLTQTEKLILFQKREKSGSKFLEVSSTNFSWLSQLKASLTTDSNVVLHCKAKEPEGILGLVNCLRREPNASKVRCVFLMEDAPDFDPESKFYSDQLRKNLAVNIFKDNTWGTYRHLLLEKVQEVEREHGYVNNTTRGDLSSMKWLEGPLSMDNHLPPGHSLVAIHYSSVNFRDVMVSSGRVNVEAFTMDRTKQDSLLGFEFCGRDMNGRRVTGMTLGFALGSYITCQNHQLIEIPDHFSFEDAATITVVYSTVLYALIIVGGLKPGSSVLIHSGTGGVGLAALNVCTHYGCDIYVTVGTREKREYLKEHYPHIPESHIGNSRDTSFEDMIKTGTRGRGVDFVLNSLSDEKLKASVRCLGRGGRFLEIGKFDLANNTQLELLFMEKQASFHGIMLDKICLQDFDMFLKIMAEVRKGIEAGYVKPLPRVVFEKDNVEAAYRYMMTGKHIGKVIIKIREEEEERRCLPKKELFKVIPSYFCDPDSSYIIIGGLGGIGMELADWLFLRGARKLVLVSRTGIQNGYQTQRIQIWASYGTTIRISTQDVTTKQGCLCLIEEANRLGPVDAIFNLAVLLKDSLFEDQTEETFRASLAPKAVATKYLDQVTREKCPNLRSFVVFSSVSCGRGNVGQTNYGMANSIMERICEKRKRDGFAALAIQWGAVGEVGLVAKLQKDNKELVIGGTLQQKVSSCFEALGRFLTQNHPVVSSMVVAEKHNKSYGLLSAVEAVAQVLGIKDIKTVSPHLSLAELGMDSMMGTEIMQLLEKDFEIYLTPKDMRSLTFARLTELEAEKKASLEEKTTTKILQGVDFFIKSIPDSTTSYIPVLNLQEKEGAPTIFVFPGMDGVLDCFKPMLEELDLTIMGVQYKFKDSEDSITETSQNLIPHIEKYFSKDTPFLFIAYSFGADVALEVAAHLERGGTKGTIILIDGSPNYLMSAITATFPEMSEAELQTEVIFKTLSFLLPIEFLLEHKDKFLQCESLQKRIDLGESLLPNDLPNKEKLNKQGIVPLYNRLKSMIDYKYDHEKIDSKVFLFKAKYPFIKVEEDYQLGTICQNLVVLEEMEGDHVTVLLQAELWKNIKEIIECKS